MAKIRIDYWRGTVPSIAQQRLLFPLFPSGSRCLEAYMGPCLVSHPPGYAQSQSWVVFGAQKVIVAPKVRQDHNDTKPIGYSE
jgi:hypothetical protein